MINLSLFELAVATCFSSERLAFFYKQLLVNRTQLFTKGIIDREVFHRQCCEILSQSLDRDYPRKFRLNELDAIFELIWPVGVFTHNKLPILDHCFESLMTSTNEQLHYKVNRVDSYAKLLARLDTAILVGWHLAKAVNNQPQGLSLDKVNNLNSIFAPNPIDDSAYAENHTHLGGMHYDGLVLMAGLLNQGLHITDRKITEKLTPLFGLIRLLLSYSAELDNQKINCLPNKIANELNNNWLISESNQIDLSIYADESFSANAINHTASTTLVFIRQQLAIAIKENKLMKAWVWLNTWLWRCYQQIDNLYIRISIVYLITDLMAVRRQLIMDGRGLTRFVQYFHRPYRAQSANSKARLYDSVNKLFMGNEDKAEIKLTCDAITLEGIKLFIEQLTEVYRKSHKVQQQLFECWHICVHFLRRKHYQNQPQLIWQKAYELKQKLVQLSLWSDDMLNTEQTKVRNQFLHPLNWIRGLDVAGDENLTSIEVFAPAIRWLRNQVAPELNHSFHLSIHAGEDFNHPLTGMRNIDETIEFCEFSKGDRIGHGLAVGIKPQDWFELHGDVLMDVDDYFDNLVWAWGYSFKLETKFLLAKQVKLILEKRIVELAKHVSWLHQNGLHTCKVSDFYDAWKLRKNCFYQYQQSQDFMQQPLFQGIALPHYKKINESSIAGKIYLARWRYKTCDKVIGFIKDNKHKKSKIYLTLDGDMDELEIANNLQCVLQVTVSEKEIDFYHLVQDVMLNKLAKKDIRIEVNLTSNVYIANVEDYHLHPIFRWFPIDSALLDDRFNVRKTVNEVCINTDDAGIMPTTLRTEFELLAKVAKKHCKNERLIEKWIAKLKLAGVTIFEDNHVNLFKNVDIEQFLRELYPL